MSSIVNLIHRLNHGLSYFFALFQKRRTLIFQIFAGVSVLIFLLSSALVYINNRLNYNSVSEGIIGTYTENDLPQSVTKLLSKSLVKIDPSGLPQPELAESWTVSEDGKKYTVKLRDDLYWSNGEKIIATDIDVSIPDVSLTVIDNKTLEFNFPESFSPFLTLLDKPIFKKDTTPIDPEKGVNIQKKYLGTGPYVIKGVAHDQVFISRLVLTPRNKALKKEYLELTIRFYPTERIAKNASRLGEVKSVLGVQDISDIQMKDNVGTISTTTYTQLVTIFYNTQDAILSDENFRQALSFAAPSIAGEVEAKTSIPPTSWAFNPDVKDYLDNPDQAKATFDKVENGKDTVITLTATSFLQKVGEQVVENWKKQGIKASLKVESGVPQNFQALLITQNIPQDPDQYALWHSTQTQTNISKFTDSRVSPRIDKDLEDGRKSLDLETRKTKYHDFQKVLLDNAPATFLYFPKYNVVFLKKAEDSVKKVLELQI